MTTEITPEEMIKKLKRINMTPEEIQMEEARELGENLGKIIGATIATVIIATIIWAVLVYLFAVNVTWLQTMGGFLLFNIITNGIARKFK